MPKDWDNTDYNSIESFERQGIELEYFLKRKKKHWQRIGILLLLFLCLFLILAVLSFENSRTQYSFSEGNNLFDCNLLAVEVNGKFGYFNSFGEMVIPPLFDNAWQFGKDELAMVMVGKQYGFINTEGDYVVRPQYEGAMFFHNGYAAVQNDGKWGYVNKSGYLVVASVYSHAKAFSQNGLAAVSIRMSPHDQWGYVDEHGREVIPLSFRTAGKFVGGLAAVKTQGQWGYIDEKGEYVIEPQFPYATAFSEKGYAYVGLNLVEDDDIAVIKKDGAWLDKETYKDIDRLISVYFRLNETDLIDNHGARKFEEDFNIGIDLIPASFEGYAENGYVNPDGEIVIPPLFDDAFPFATNGIARVRMDGKMGFIDDSGAVVIEPIYDYASDFYDDGFAIVRQGINFGVIDGNGDHVIPMEYHIKYYNDEIY